jgi:hypothetical protein
LEKGNKKMEQTISGKVPVAMAKMFAMVAAPDWMEAPEIFAAAPWAAV